MKQATQKQKTKVAHAPIVKTGSPAKFVKRMGHWVPKPSRMEILTCKCGNKYIKTRAGQEVCVRCLNKVS